MNTLTRACTLILFTYFIAKTAIAQQTKKQKHDARITSIKNMVDSASYVFKADYAYPLRGTQKNLTSDYDVRVSKDTIIAYLPYYGRAYVAPQDPTEGGIKFTSTKFNYVTEPQKKGGWRVVVTPKDNNGTDWRDVRQLVFFISSEGYTSLQVTSTNRDPISFNGTVERR